MQLYKSIETKYKQTVHVKYLQRFICNGTILLGEIVDMLINS